jgi:hypothetical protein
VALLTCGTGLLADQPQAFNTPQDALDAMVAALRAQDADTLLVVFGSDARDLLSTGNPDRDARNREAILDLYDAGYRFRPGEDGRAEILLGADGWAFPVPLAKSGDIWAFDIEAGKDEVYFRRIGLNEIDAIEMMEAYVDVQAEYRLIDHDGDGVMEFASALLSSDNARDGLFWVGADSPLGERIALASLDGYSIDGQDVEAEPFGGYYYRILTAQTAAAPGGAMDYIHGGNMVAGHALLAVPSDYGQSAIHSFLVSENGTVLQADLGEDSLEIAFGMTAYDPGPVWTLVEPIN